MHMAVEINMYNSLISIIILTQCRYFVRNTVKQTEESVSPDYDLTWKIKIVKGRRRIKESEKL
jgi:hypothetical protein